MLLGLDEFMQIDFRNLMWRDNLNLPRLNHDPCPGCALTPAYTISKRQMIKKHAGF
jgi:hypothetical protein